MLIENADYFVRMVELPEGVRGATAPNDDGTFSVYLNSRLSREIGSSCLEHELRHIVHDDFSRPQSVEEKERDARCE